MSGDPLRTSQTHYRRARKGPDSYHWGRALSRTNRSRFSMFLRRLARLAANEPSLIDLQFHYVRRISGVERDHNAIFSMRR